MAFLQKCSCTACCIPTHSTCHRMLQSQHSAVMPTQGTPNTFLAIVGGKTISLYTPTGRSSKTRVHMWREGGSVDNGTSLTFHCSEILQKMNFQSCYHEFNMYIRIVTLNPYFKVKTFSKNVRDVGMAKIGP